MCSLSCASPPPITHSSDSALADSFVQIDGVQEAVAAPSSDGSSTAKRPTLRIYFDEPATTDLGAITTDSLKLVWNSPPMAYVLWVRNVLWQSLPYDNSKRVEFTTVLLALDLPNSRVYRGDLYPTIGDPDAKFGVGEWAPRPFDRHPRDG